ncbi:hypothetical protein F511_32614 [Dorcoceras hygrometricum]|uniref:Uncharacterized protein n=1 Tax=Dorcoceras hygrometricum TaxID=472368 RepID=A0A2Z7AQ83_9LAMI|nr:hypothetical protein F511_32614 [Dorcoceras hygrometricum]
MNGDGIPSSACTRRPDEIGADGFSSSRLAGTNSGEEAAAAAYREERGAAAKELGITDSACKNQLVVVSVQYAPFNPYITIRSTTIGKSRVAVDPIAMHTSWRLNSDIASVTRPKNLKFQNRSKPSPISHTGPKSSRAARDRPEQNPRKNQPSRHRRSVAERRPAAAPPPRKTRGGSARCRAQPAPSHRATSAREVAQPVRIASSQRRTQLATSSGANVRTPSTAGRPPSRGAAIIEHHLAWRKRPSPAAQSHAAADRLRSRCARSGSATGAHVRNSEIRYNKAVIVLIRSENLGSDTTVGIRTTPPGGAVEEQKHVPGDIHRVFRSTTGDGIPSSACTRRPEEIGADGFSSSRLVGTNPAKRPRRTAAAAAYREERGAAAKELGLGFNA